MDNVEKTSMFCDNCQDFGELPFLEKKGEIQKLLSADDMRGYQSKKTNNSRKN